ncbi:MAG: potassium transporter TrkG, partial [Candidatus Wallbacteria bacterium]|nr:potassium transporter TrkG [Candidatus Wallbacteria bacterium]
MKSSFRYRPYMTRIGLEGFLLSLSPLPFLFPFIDSGPGFPPAWHMLSASLAAVACFWCGLTLFRKPLVGKILGSLSAACCCAASFHLITTSPFAALSASVALISIAFALLDFRFNTFTIIRTDHQERSLQRAWWATMTVPAAAIFSLIMGMSDTLPSNCIVALTSVISQALFLQWVFAAKLKRYLLIPASGCMAIGWFFLSSTAGNVTAVTLAISLLTLAVLPRKKVLPDKIEHWWNILFNNQTRILLTTFLALCITGTFLLLIPAATRSGAITAIDAAFTSVSAVCVTGLVVLDTPHDFTVPGQMIILLLIQLGGLGIMSIATVAMHVMGHRLSLKQEYLLSSMADTDHKDLVRSLAIILKFTFSAELIGAVLLTSLFYTSGEEFLQALWRGIF